MKAVLVIVIFFMAIILPAIFRHEEIEIEAEFSAFPPKLKIKLKKKLDKSSKKKHKNT